MNTIVISAFPGTGKTHYYNNHKDICLDSDSSQFSWAYREDENGNTIKERNPDFPANYIKHIKENIGKVRYIFVSSHKEVMCALVKAGIKFVVVYPNISLKEEYIGRYFLRGSSVEFCKLVDSNWDDWINTIISNKDLRFEVGDYMAYNKYYDVYELKHGEYINDILTCALEKGIGDYENQDCN